MITHIETRAHAIIPLALFETIRSLDLPTDDGLVEFHDELTSKRLGMNRAVVTQIERYARLAHAGERVDGEEVVALLRLVGRRSDAGLVFADAGRRAAGAAARRVSGLLRVARRALPVGREALGFRLARAAAREVFGVRLGKEGGVVVATQQEQVAVRATPNGAACGFYGSAAAELLRVFSTFDNALLHTACRARGDRDCLWRAGAPAEG